MAKVEEAKRGKEKESALRMDLESVSELSVCLVCTELMKWPLQ